MIPSLSDLSLAGMPSYRHADRCGLASSPSSIEYRSRRKDTVETRKTMASTFTEYLDPELTENSSWLALAACAMQARADPNRLTLDKRRSLSHQHNGNKPWSPGVAGLAALDVCAKVPQKRRTESVDGSPTIRNQYFTTLIYRKSRPTDMPTSKLFPFGWNCR